MVGLITKNDETAYREEVRALAEHTIIHIDRAVVERVKSFKFLGVHITDNLKWSLHTGSMVKNAQQPQGG